jgi:hypothetical protein
MTVQLNEENMSSINEDEEEDKENTFLPNRLNEDEEALLMFQGKKNKSTLEGSPMINGLKNKAKGVVVEKKKAKK